MNKFFSKKQCLFLLFVICFNFGIYYSARYISNPFYHYSFETIIDLKIPCIPWMIIFYWGCYIFWIINYLLCIKYEKGKPNQFIVSHFIGESICFLCFLFIPTTMHRPDVQGNGFFETILKLTYLYDQPDNLFPSIHCFASWLCWIGVRRNKDIPRWYQFVSLGIALLICITTLTVKQHVLADVISGIALAEISYVIAKYSIK